MADTTVVQADFSRAMVRDTGRDDPVFNQGAVWNLVDYIPGLDAPLSKRGGWAYASNDISAVKATASYVISGIYAPFSAAAKNLAIDEDGELYVIAAGGGVTDIGLAIVPQAPLSFHRDLAIITNNNGTTAPKSYDGTTLQNLAGSPPACRFSTVYKDLLCLASKSGNEQTVYFSGDGSPISGFDTATRYVNISFPFSGIAALRNALLCFSNQRLERIIGSTPPPASDMVRQTLFEPGCVDARSIKIYEDQCIFANGTGIYMTDGAAIMDLTFACNARKYWRELMSSYTSSYTLAAGMIRNLYKISVMNGSTFVDCLVFDVTGRKFWRDSNVKATSFWNSVGTAPETYFGVRSAPRVGSMSSMFTPSATYKNDGDGTAVTPVLETGWFRLGDSPSRMGDLYVTYDMRDAASDNPTMSAQYVGTPEETSYSNVIDRAGATKTFAESTTQVRQRGVVNKALRGIGFKFAQTNASSVTRFHEIAATGHAREGSRLS